MASLGSTTPEPPLLIWLSVLSDNECAVTREHRKYERNTESVNTNTRSTWQRRIRLRLTSTYMHFGIDYLYAGVCVGC
ncbi:hypothetical protein JR316_0002861 [Psilocybe cubensis]|uniref:Uncharacterized protein n=1 Tax=Psilocybe cubensis TaxID=181762 RepID=A0ACB8H8A0_PSICU|nr:hypothetical protein JR316_0002861 [Psilocybe cubensis]KAH9483395.1 hypothetical protein JR316_0002861 [Psilocybe cubensis]